MKKVCEDCGKTIYPNDYLRPGLIGGGQTNVPYVYSAKDTPTGLPNMPTTNSANNKCLDPFCLTCNPTKENTSLSGSFNNSMLGRLSKMIENE